MPTKFISLLTTFSEGLIILCNNAELLLSLHEKDVGVAGHIPRKPADVFFEVKQMAERLGVPAVATPSSFFLHPEEHETHCVLRAIALNTSLSRLPRHEVTPPDAWLAPPQAYAQRFAVFPEALKATHALAERCAFAGPDTETIFPNVSNLGWSFDLHACDEPISIGDTKPGHPNANPASALLRRMAYEGARQRYGEDLAEAIVERIEYELASIEDKGFSDYFLVVKDIVRRSPRICGRGSGAASIIAYALGITNVCPVKFNLYFERFLNPGRSDPPDIDIDFAWDERDGVLEEVLNHYAGHSAMVCNHVTFKPRMAIREVAKVFGLSDGEIDRMDKRFDWRAERWDGQPPGAQQPFPFWTCRTRGGTEPLQLPLLDGVAAMGAKAQSPSRKGSPPCQAGAKGGAPQNNNLSLDAPWPDIMRIANHLIGAPRHLSVHPGGVIITPRPIDEYVPIERAPKGVPILHWEKDGAEEMGLVKIDLLGNRSLAVIRDAIANVRANGLVFDEARWEPEDDPATQRAVASGETMGCFYIESPGMRLLQRKTGKGDYKHLVIHSSIIRPAANEYIREYVRRLRGGSWTHFHPLLEDVLDETYGIMVYQEHVSLAAMALANFSHSEADRLRKVLSKKDHETQLADFRSRFFEGARKRGIDDECLTKVWNMMMSFAGYSFCKPHSASYARVSFQAACLKVHYPAEFMAAVISNQGGFYSAFAYVSEARRLGVAIDHPDVNRSEIRWTGCGHRARVGLLSIGDLSGATQARLIHERATRPYASLFDFLERVNPDEREARAFVQCGACDALEPNHDRVALLWDLARWHYERTHPKRKRSPTLFDGLGAAAQDDPPPALPPTGDLEALHNEYAVLGFLCDRHPMVLFEPELSRMQSRMHLVKAIDLKHHAGRRVRVAGWLITGKMVSTKHGELMEFLTFEDDTGLTETTFFPKVYQRTKHLLVTGGPYIISGLVEEEFGAVTLTADRLEPLRAQRS